MGAQKNEPSPLHCTSPLSITVQLIYGWVRYDMIYRRTDIIAYIFMRCTNTTARMTTTAFLNRNSHDSFILSVPVRSFGGFILTGKFLDSYRTFVCHINSPLCTFFGIRFTLACWGSCIERLRILPLPFVGTNWVKHSTERWEWPLRMSSSNIFPEAPVSASCLPG